ncbi:hypothetical protein RRG08_025867 [Elysia crispata]|uniref:Uncharacterized protein n=1 Tax=Elysia crispata TaxID=231223 RepID=A0AAE0ZQM5_9GAST|nr:hypothetical protein RRG08_025867 [Elysia crispata]
MITPQLASFDYGTFETHLAINLHKIFFCFLFQAVGALLDSGCDVTLVDNQGLTAAELADKCDPPEAAALIRGEVTLDQLSLEEDYLSSQELPTQRPTQLQSPCFNFPPPPPFPPEEEEQEPEEKLFYDSVASTKYQRDQSQPTAPVQSLDSPSLARLARERERFDTPTSPATSTFSLARLARERERFDTPTSPATCTFSLARLARERERFDTPPLPPHVPLALHDSPVRGRDLTPPPPPPPLPLALPDTPVRGRDLTPPPPPPPLPLALHDSPVRGRDLTPPPPPPPLPLALHDSLVRGRDLTPPPPPPHVPLALHDSPVRGRDLTPPPPPPHVPLALHDSPVRGRDLTPPPPPPHVPLALHDSPVRGRDLTPPPPPPPLPLALHDSPVRGRDLTPPPPPPPLPLALHDSPVRGRDLTPPPPPPHVPLALHDSPVRGRDLTPPPPPPPVPLALHDSPVRGRDLTPPPPPPPVPLALHDSPVRGRDLTPPPPPPHVPLALHDSPLRGWDLTPPPRPSPVPLALHDSPVRGRDLTPPPPPPPVPLALHDSPVRGRDLTPPPPPPPLPLALHDSPVRGRDLTPPPPPPTPPAQATYAPPLSASDSALVWDPREVQPEQEEVFHRRVADSQLEATFSGYSGTEGQGQPIVRRTTSRLSVNSSTSDLGAFEVATVVADVHKSRGSIDSVNAVQAAPTSNSVTSAIYINSVALSNSTPKEPFQHRKFSVLKHVPQNSGIQEKPELENSNNNVATAINNNNKSSYHSISKHNTEEFSSAVWPASRHQRSPSPPLPSPPPLSPRSESINSEDASISASTSCSNLQHQEADLPPPLPQLHLLSQSRGTSLENFPPPPSEFIQAQSSSLYEELPPPPPPPPPSQLNTNSEWQSASSNQDFPDPPSPARLAIASRQKLNYSSPKDYTGSTSSERASSTSNFKQYFDSGTRANFARAKALFGAVSETNSEPNKFRLGSEGQSKVSKKGRESPAGRQPRRCVNRDSGESETDCGNIQQIGLKAGVGNKRNFKEVSPQPKLLMNPATQSDSSGPLSPALSTQSGHSIESSVNQDSVQSSVSNQGGHVTAISTSGGKNGEKAANGAATALRQDKTEGTPAGASTNTDIVKEESTTKAAVPLTDSSSSSNGVVMRGGSAGPGRALARIVVSAGPEMLARPNSLNGQSQSSPAVKKNKHDLIADIQSAVSGTSNLSLRRAKSRGEGVSMVYSSKRNSTGQDQSKMTDTTRPLTGDFDPKNFLDQVETVDTTGRTIPEWRRHVLAKHAAEKAQKEFEERRVEEDYESRFKDMPAWKRALIERREAQAREEEAASKK